MRARLVTTMLAGWVLSVGGCGGGQAQKGPVEAAPTTAEIEVPQFDIDPGFEPLSLREAKALIARLEEGWPVPDDAALNDPSSLEDALAVLKRDQVNLFPGAVEYIDTKTGLEADSLHAQIELAWGEAYVIVTELMSRCAQQFDIALLGRGGLVARWPEDKKQRLQNLTDQLNRLIEAFQLVSVEHTSKGSQKANEILSTNPESYLGYRLAADYYRTVRDWEKFTQMTDEIERLKPESNGLIFLRAAAAFSRDQDAFTAAEYYRQALERDPDFVRAQAHLVMIQQDLPSTYAQFLKLERLNPDHTLVRWTGGVLRLALRLYEGR